MREPSQDSGRAKADATCTQCSGAAKWLATVLESSNEADSICYNAVAGAVAGAADASGAEKWMRMPRGSRRLMQGLAPRHREVGEAPCEHRFLMVSLSQEGTMLEANAQRLQTGTV